MQITELELVLFLYGAVMTALYFREGREHRAARVFIRAFLENKELRDGLLADYQRLQEGQK